MPSNECLLAGYDALARAQPAITGVGCRAHARRRYVDVAKAQAGIEPEGEAARFIRLIRALYQLDERQIASNWRAGERLALPGLGALRLR